MFLIPIQAQHIDSIFMHLPEKSSPLLSKQMKFEVLEYFKAGQKDSVRNKLFGNSVIISRDTLNQSIVFRTSSVNDLQIKLFNTIENKYFIGLIETIYSPIISSELSFYDSDWNLLELDFQQPKISECFDTELLKFSSVDSVWLRKVDEQSYLGMKFQNESHYLEVTNHSLEVMNKEDKELVQTLLKKGDKALGNMIFKIARTNNKIEIRK
jgi:hypothetical protein